MSKRRFHRFFCLPFFVFGISASAAIAVPVVMATARGGEQAGSDMSFSSRSMQSSQENLDWSNASNFKPLSSDQLSQYPAVYSVHENYWRRILNKEQDFKKIAAGSLETNRAVRLGKEAPYLKLNPESKYYVDSKLGTNSYVTGEKQYFSTADSVSDWKDTSKWTGNEWGLRDQEASGVNYLPFFFGICFQPRIGHPPPDKRGFKYFYVSRKPLWNY